VKTSSSAGVAVNVRYDALFAYFATRLLRLLDHPSQATIGRAVREF
jgi:hypothetical protein